MADVIIAGDTRVDLAAALGGAARLGAGVVLCEGGPTLNGQLAAQDLVDELCLTVAPPSWSAVTWPRACWAAPTCPSLLPMTLVHALEDEGDLYLRYRASRRR